jgi:hypothetical protein
MHLGTCDPLTRVTAPLLRPSGHYEILRGDYGGFQRVTVERDGNCLFIAMLRLHDGEICGEVSHRRLTIIGCYH